jgi:hypothetical protein
MANPILNNTVPPPPKRHDIAGSNTVSDEWFKWFSAVFKTIQTGNLGILNTDTINVTGTVTAGNGFFGDLTGNVNGTVSSTNNINGGAAGEVVYQTSHNHTGFVTPGTDGQVLSLSSGLPVWVDPPNTQDYNSAMIASTFRIF